MKMSALVFRLTLKEPFFPRAREHLRLVEAVIVQGSSSTSRLLSSYRIDLQTATSSCKHGLSTAGCPHLCSDATLNASTLSRFWYTLQRHPRDRCSYLKQSEKVYWLQDIEMGRYRNMVYICIIQNKILEKSLHDIPFHAVTHFLRKQI